MRRREYIYTTGAALTVALAGCSESADDSGDSETDNPETTSKETGTPDNGDTNDGTANNGGIEGEPPDWADWIPATTFDNSDASIFALDVRTARQDFPREQYEAFRIPDLADVYGVDEANIDYFVGIERPDGKSPAVLTGDFDQQAILDHMDISDDRTETVQSFEVIDGDLAVSDEGVINGQGYAELIDAKTGRTAALGTTDDEWEELLVAVSDGAFVTVTEGTMSGESESDIDADVHKSGVMVEVTDSGGMRLTAHLLFASTSRAEATLEEYDQEIINEVRGDNPDHEVQSLEVEGRRVVLVLESDTFEF